MRKTYLFRWIALFDFTMRALALAAAQPDTFVMSFDRPLDSVNYFSQTGYVYYDMSLIVFDSLLIPDPDTAEYKPALAERWEIDKKRHQITFHLRKNAKFHNGDPVTAADVKFSYECHSDPRFKSIRLSSAAKEVRMEAKDTHTIIFQSELRNTRQLMNIAKDLQILPQKYYGDLGQEAEWGKIAIGSGPYRMASFQRSKRMELERNPDWWGIALPEFKEKYNFKKIMVRYISDPLVAEEMLKRGELDLIRYFEPQEFLSHTKGTEWGKSVLAIQTRDFLPKGTRQMILNQRNPIFADRRARLALLYLFNREDANQKLYGGMLESATGPWHRELDFADPKVEPIPYDPKQAQKLLREAGWSDSDADGILDKEIDGKKTDFHFTILNYKADREKLLTTYKEAAKKIGIDVEVKTIEAQMFFKLVNELKFEATYTQAAWSMPEADLGLDAFFHSKYATNEPGASNRMGYKNPAADKLIEKIYATTDQRPPKALLRQLYALLATDAAQLDLFNDAYVLYGVSRRVIRPHDARKYDFGYHYWKLPD